ncbi:hypothetical protein BASA61_007173 [Batrachochytrium salamandrivorans]|nr:hypothetical protein BASA62_002523 [Batrachochytrium salamandrivorans]KAH6577691.1 hypothetical protein BASA60_003888 [Batrachochytrium salamandrivorans]KAH6584952.1 hypothetical protein BASA61_007173 [Batrachochytrium salamandrivorans]KAH9273989.1 hypothetical protein BASA83_003624 [Batrachochytrium salamandrivorans]
MGRWAVGLVPHTTKSKLPCSRLRHILDTGYHYKSCHTVSLHAAPCPFYSANRTVSDLTHHRSRTAWTGHLNSTVRSAESNLRCIHTGTHISRYATAQIVYDELHPHIQQQINPSISGPTNTELPSQIATKIPSNPLTHSQLVHSLPANVNPTEELPTDPIALAALARLEEGPAQHRYSERSAPSVTTHPISIATQELSGRYNQPKHADIPNYEGPLISEIVSGASFISQLNSMQTPGIDLNFQLSPEQKEIMDIIEEGGSIYFTGKAGSGKTQLIRHIAAKMRLTGHTVSITAPTGIAASLIGGKTLHSFLGINGLTSEPSIQKIVQRIRLEEPRSNKYMLTDLFILDEASMISASLFTTLDQVFRQVRGRLDEPFGGVQIVLTGDFFQLPPIESKPAVSSRDASRELLLNDPSLMDDLRTFSKSSRLVDAMRFKECSKASMATTGSDVGGDSSGVSSPVSTYFGGVDHHSSFLFDSPSWGDLIQGGMHKRELSVSFRQKDELFVALLDDIRYGICSQKHWEFLSPYLHTTFPEDGIEPMMLSVFRRDADAHNWAQLRKLKTPVVFFDAVDLSILPKRQGRSYPGAVISGDIDADIMRSAINREFDQFQADRVLPLRVGAQVVLLRNINVAEGLVNGTCGIVVDFKTAFDELLQRNVILPVVLFAPHGREPRSFLVGNCQFSSHVSDLDIKEGNGDPCNEEDSDNNENAPSPLIPRIKRVQLPLKLAWAMTIHKAQGMTLDRVDIDVSKSFAPGQGYVALSRVRDLSGLRIRHFGDRSVVVSSKVLREFSGMVRS